MKFNKTFPAMMIAAAVLFAGADAQAVDYRYQQLDRQAHKITNLMVEIQPELVAIYPRARNFDRIILLSDQVTRKANKIRHAANSGIACNWQLEISQLEDLIYRLQRNVDAANHRAEIGVDPPLYACNLNLLSCLAEMRGDARYLAQLVPRSSGVEYGKTRVVPQQPLQQQPSYIEPLQSSPRQLGPADLAPSIAPGSSSYYRPQRNNVIRIGNLAVRF